MADPEYTLSSTVGDFSGDGFGGGVADGANIMWGIHFNGRAGIYARSFLATHVGSTSYTFVSSFVEDGSQAGPF